MPNTTKLISCRLTESDSEALRSHAESLELNQSDYIRHLIRIPVDGDGLATGEALISLDTPSGVFSSSREARFSALSPTSS